MTEPLLLEQSVSMSHVAGPALLREKLDSSERAARQLADACFAAWGTLGARSSGVSRAANLLMDCSYVASATARLLCHADDYQLHTLSMHVAVCRRVARQCADVCEQQANAMSACAATARAAVASFSDLLAFLWDTTRPQRERTPEHELIDEPDESVA